MRKPCWFGTLGLLTILVCLSASAADTAGLLQTLRAVGPKGAGHAAAAQAWAELARGDAQTLPALLAGLDGANPLSANWILTAIDAVAERAAAGGGRLPSEALEQFVLHTQHAPQARRVAYELLLQSDPSAADRLLPGMLDDLSLELRRDAVARATDEAAALEKAEQRAQAVGAYRKVLTAARDLDQVQLLAGRLRTLGEKVDLARHFGFLMHWHLIGPFDNMGEKGYDVVDAPEREIDLAATYPGKHGQVKWIEYATQQELGQVDLNKALGEEKGVAGYATTEFVSDKRQEVQFRLTSINAVKLWLNGRLIDQHKVYHGGSQLDQYVCRAVLEPGRNVILVKACQNELMQEWARNWGFQLRVCDERGTAILSADREKEEAAAGAGGKAGGEKEVVVAPPSPQPSPGGRGSSLPVANSSAGVGSDWRGYHGTDGTSVSDEKGLPVTFDDEHHLAWKVALPGAGPSGAIIVGNRVVVTCATGPRQDRLHLLCLDAGSGRTLWHRQLWTTGAAVFNPFGGVAAPTPASDGQRIVAFYSSNDLACFDLEGNLQWHRGLGYEHPLTRNDVGMASSPLIAGDTVVVQAENQGDSFAAGIDLATGETRWHQVRESLATWTSPVLLHGKTPAQDVVLLQSKSRLTVHEPRSGRQLWAYEANCHTMATSVVVGDRIYLPANNALVALRWDPAKQQADVLWQEQRLRMDSTSPIVHGGRVYVMKAPGIVVCGDAENGNVLWQFRLKGPFWASPLWADGRLYAVNHDGLVQALELGSEGKLLGTSQIDKGILASPAAAHGALYFRSNGWLWKAGG